ncbi:MAG TPA: serine protease [Longimicrobiaceae bacterium]
MNGIAVAIALTAAQFALAGKAMPQTAAVVDPLEPEVRRAYEAISASVVRLRTDARVELTVPDPSSGLRSVVKRPLSVHGSGIVIGTTEVNGRTEYLVLTNHHVADPTNYVVQEGHFLKENRNNTRAVPRDPEQTFIAVSEDGEDSPEDIPLIEIARDVRGDMTLLRTVGADRELPVFGGHIGFDPAEVEAGMQVITTGYPNGGRRMIDSGEIVELNRRHELGPVHYDFILSLPVEHGQSGSPVFIARREGGDGVTFLLIGLLHAREKGTSYMVPSTLWQHALEEAPGVSAFPGLLAEAGLH